MATLYASLNYVEAETSRREVTLTEDSTVYGDKVVWVSDTTGDDITLGRYDQNNASEYIDVKNPLIVVKCANNASSTNTIVYDTDGSTVLHTFIADHSSAVAYAAFRLRTGNRNTNSWRVA